MLLIGLVLRVRFDEGAPTVEEQHAPRAGRDDRWSRSPCFAAPGIRFVALEASEAAFRTAVLTHPNADSLATRAFLSALAQTAGDRVVHSPRAAVELAA